MPTIAFTLDYCQEIGGSNVVIRDIAAYFRKNDWDVTLFALRLSDLVRSRFEVLGCHVVALETSDYTTFDMDFDVMWATHWTAYGPLLLNDKMSFKNLVVFSMSPFAEVENTSFLVEEADILISNSEENLEYQENKSSNNIYILPNSLNLSFFENAKPSNNSGIKSICYIGNHKTPELHMALDMLADRGVAIDRAGRFFVQKDANEDYIDKHDVVVTIGHSVQKSMARKRPVYIYDRFGGPGYLTRSTLKEAEFTNFSGRGALSRSQWKQPEEIACEILTKLPSETEIDSLYDYANHNFTLETRLSKIVKSFDFLRKSRRIDSRKYAFQKAIARQRLDTLIYGAFPIVTRDRTKLWRIIKSSVTEDQERVFIRIDRLPSVHGFVVGTRSLGVSGLVLFPEAQTHIVAETDDGMFFYGYANNPSPPLKNRFNQHQHADKSGFFIGVAVSSETKTIKFYARGARINRHIFSIDLEVAE